MKKEDEFSSRKMIAHFVEQAEYQKDCAMDNLESLVFDCINFVNKKFGLELPLERGLYRFELDFKTSSFSIHIRERYSYPFYVTNDFEDNCTMAFTYYFKAEELYNQSNNPKYKISDEEIMELLNTK